MRSSPRPSSTASTRPKHSCGSGPARVSTRSIPRRSPRSSNATVSRSPWSCFRESSTTRDRLSRSRRSRDSRTQKGCVVGFDLAHAAGNLVLSLHDWNVDFAVWCTYKYLNSGPGSVGACFVHERHGQRRDLPRLAGWWGHDKESRFRMEPGFRPIPGAEGWQLSNPPILSLAAIRASLDVFMEAGGMEPLREKSLRLTGYLEWLLQRELGDAVKILTPERPASEGVPALVAGEVERFGKNRLRETRGGRRHLRLARARRDPGGSRPPL